MNAPNQNYLSKSMRLEQDVKVISNFLFWKAVEAFEERLKR